MPIGLQGSLMVDIAGTWLTAEDRHLLRQPEVAGLIIFARNIDSPRQVRELCASIRAVRPDLILAVDQEGGRVQRLRQGFVRLPAMRDIGECANASSLAEACGWLMATEVLAVGLDLSFAPVLDLDHQRSAVVGRRAFEGDPQRVVELAGAFIDGMNAAGMAACGKHFPGHGWAEADSHVAIPTDERSLDTLRAVDMVPFARLGDRLAAVMPAHVIYPQVDTLPAGFSPTTCRRPAPMWSAMPPAASKLRSRPGATWGWSAMTVQRPSWPCPLPSVWACALRPVSLACADVARPVPTTVHSRAGRLPWLRSRMLAWSIESASSLSCQPR